MVTREEIDAKMTPAGGWTKETLASWGVPWPPPKGWKKALLGEEEKPAFGEWQPIETAPKDGTAVLLAGGEDDDACYARDSLEEWNMMSPCRAWWNGKCWQMTTAEASYVVVSRERPTHWMPLPAPPKT